MKYRFETFCPVQVNITKGSITDKGFREVSFSQIDSDEICPVEICPAEICSHKDDPIGICQSEISLVEVSFTQISL